MSNSEALSEQERAIEVPVAEHTITMSALMDASSSEAGMHLLIGLSRSRKAWSAHQTVAIAWTAILDAGIRGAEARQHQRRIEQFVADGFAWLLARGLVGPAAEHAGGPQWIITTDGIEAAEQASVDHIEATLRLHAELHPALDASARPNFERGDYATAVFAATHEVEVAVRAASGLGDDKYGVQLMRDAFKIGGPLAATDDPASEQEALRDLFVGTIGAFKNPSSHRVVRFDSPIEAANILHLADTLLRAVDRAEARRGSEDAGE